MLNEHWIVLQVVIPLLAAPVCSLITCRKTAWTLATTAVGLSFVLSVLLFMEVQAIGSFSYEMGGWAPPVGIEYRLDSLNSFVLLLVSAVGFVCLLYARHTIDAEIQKGVQRFFYAAYLLCFVGLSGITITNDAFNVYVFLEISSLAMYGLIAMGRDRRALIASFEYLILGTIGATFILIAIGLLYMMTGTLNITDLSERIDLFQENLAIRAALAFFTIGVGLKIAVFPLHLWLVNGYTNAPSAVSAFLSATGTKVSIYLLIRLFFDLFGYEMSFKSVPVDTILGFIAILGIVMGSLAAMFQHNVKRLLAYSSVAQVGYILLGISLGTEAGLAAALVHVFNHALAKAALFMAVGYVAYRMLGSSRLKHFAGIGKQMPWTMAAFIIAGVSLIGLPFTAGFISKVALITALMQQEMWLYVALVLISSLMAVVYVWKVVEVAYFEKPHIDPRVKDKEAALAKIKEMPLIAQLSLWAMALASIYFGVQTELTYSTAADIAQRIMGAI